MADQLRAHPHHDPPAGIIALPHGPETGDDAASYPYAANPENEKEIFNYLLHPDDSYDANGVYWADMGIAQRAKFVSANDMAEAKKELTNIGRMMKEDPLSPVGWYFRNAVLPGAGLGLEGWVRSSPLRFYQFD